jgi:hypothetical protein
MGIDAQPSARIPREPIAHLAESRSSAIRAGTLLDPAQLIHSSNNCALTFCSLADFHTPNI